MARISRLNIDADMTAIEQNLSRLELGFVLGREDQGDYFYRVPLFREMILNDSPDVKLKAEIDTWKSGRNS